MLKPLEWAAQLREAAAEYGRDHMRRARNKNAQQEDILGASILATLWLAVALKTWLGGEAVLSLVPASYAAHELAVALVLTSRFRSAYVRWRELSYLATVLHGTMNTIAICVWGRSSILTWHGGSSLRLVLALAGANGSIGQFNYFGFDGFWQPFVAAALPLTVLPPLAASRPLCQRLLEDASAHNPLASLHLVLQAAHFTVMTPYGWLPPQQRQPLQQCLQVNVYLAGMVGCALPLLAAWQLRELQQRRQHATADPHSAELPGAPPDAALPRLCRLFLASCLVWCCSEVAALMFAGSFPNVFVIVSCHNTGELMATRPAPQPQRRLDAVQRARRLAADLEAGGPPRRQNAAL